MRASVLLPELGSPVNQTVNPIGNHPFLVKNLDPLIQLDCFSNPTSRHVILDRADPG
jgi:hypothetical protein